MDKLLFYMTFCCLFLLSSLSLSSTAYTVPQHYFINCGSSSTTTVYGLQTFSGDSNSGMITAGKTSSVEDFTSSNTSELYRTARIFKNPSVYELDIVQTGIHIVRFHFFPFPALGNLSAARFSVDASVFRILSNFSIKNINVSNSPIIEEFLLRIYVGKFSIRFIPVDQMNSFAFVNAMEVFIAPPDLFNDSALHVIHRINVGGEDILPNSDKLYRNWISDDTYLLNKEIAKNSKPYTGIIYYQTADYPEFVAPSSVYNTAKEMRFRNGSDGLNSSSKIQWRFDVNRGAKFFIRLHLCDIVSTTANEFLRFNLFINSNFTYEVIPYEHDYRPAAAFYVDFEVDSDDSSVLDISVGSINDSIPPTAFLNGLEIFEVVSSNSKLGKKHSSLLIVIGSSIGGSIFVVICFTLAYFGLRKKGLKHVGSSNSKSSGRALSNELNLGLKVSLSEIVFATKNFDSKLVIGEGGFGKVYKGVMRDGTNVAVKRSEAEQEQGLPEFQTEIIVLSKIRHQHLVSLIGYCCERDEMILIYEFMEKGTLRDHLYLEGNPKNELSWEKRLEICIGAAKGIHYLHTGVSRGIIHRDIKSTNILLDGDYIAKVADFGISKFGPCDDQTHVSTAVKGSVGYLDPYYFRCLQLTQKSDVYSFGVVLLEVVSAKAVIDQQREKVSLAEWGLWLQRKGKLEMMIDPFIAGGIKIDCLRKFGEIVEKCLEEYGVDRPDMVDVLRELEYCLQLQQSAIVEASSSYDDDDDDDSVTDVVQRLPCQIEDECSSFLRFCNEICDF